MANEDLPRILKLQERLKFCCLSGDHVQTNLFSLFAMQN